MTPSAGATAFLYHHIVLPPKLPQEDDNDATHERSLFEMVIQALQYLRAIADDSYADAVTSAIVMIKNLRDSRDVHGNVNEVQLETLLSALTVGVTNRPVPLEIKAQNAAVLISRDKQDLTFEFFELSPTNETALRSTRLTRTFPSYASRVAVAKMMNPGLRKSIASTITKMATQSAPGFQPQARKNGKNQDEYRDTTAPGIVTDLLMTIITALGETTEVKRITKATREDVLWKDCKQPWRRSPLWLLVRVSLQLWFNRKATHLQSSDSLYKAFMICMLSQLLDSATKNWKTLGSETVHNVSTKLIQRIRKFELLKQCNCLRSCWTKSTGDYLSNAHTVIAQHWQDLINSTENSIDTSAVKTIQPSQDLDMTLPALDAFLSKTRARQLDCSSSTFRPSSEFPSFPTDSLPANVHGSNDNRYFRLAAFEDWVDQHLQTWISLHLTDTATCGKLRHLIEHYFANATAAYAKSPVSMSIMYLTLMELWIACDRSACAQYPLLREYNHELCITELQCLVLPLKHHMERLHEVERYVDLRSNGALLHLPSVYRLFGHHSSFAVRYFDQSEELQNVLAEVERDAQRKRTQKCHELTNLKAKYENLMNQYDSKKCDIETYVYNHRHNYTTTRHPSWCSRCSCKRQADALSIDIYEWPVSSNTFVAKATIFELKLPQAFSDWRDTSTYIISEALGYRDCSAQKPSCSYTLPRHQDLSRMLASSYHRRRIVPLSSVKPHTVTHRETMTGVHYLTEDDVCLRNALQYAYFDTSLGVLIKAPPTCTEKVPKLCMYHMPERSKVLDRFMYRPPSAPDGTPANEVIASLSDCPTHFSLEEYKAFGTIPFGNEIIYSNTLAQLATSAIDFAKAETQCLILQTIQQAGLPSEDVERKTHAVVVDASLAHAMLEQLEIALQRVSENWESWRASATFSLLARRVLSLTQSPEVHKRALEYLGELRLVCFKWVTRLKARAAASTDDKQRDELNSRLTEIALLCASTYDVEDIDMVLRQECAISVLLQSSIIVQENCDSVQSEHQALYESMLQSHRAMMYRAFEKLRTHVLRNDTGLSDAVTANWAVFAPTTAGGWYSLEQPQHHWLAIKSGLLLVHFNLLTAELLVNGLPLARLPSEFMQHVMYKPLFSKSTLEVVPTDEPGLKFSARYTYHRYKLHFGMQDHDMLVVAVQGNSRLDLTPSHVFRDRLPHAFQSDFIHWYDHANDEVVFRPRHSPWISNSDCWSLKHNIYTKKWRLVKGSNVLVDLRSTSAGVLSRAVQSLEEAQHIHVVFNDSTQIVEINLPRLQLDFYVDRNFDAIYSRQFRGMIIDSQQNIGSLIGLASKLVLKSDTSERIMLIPVPRSFGTASIKYTKSSTSQHVTVQISKDDATKVYAYTLDVILNRFTDSGDLETKLLISYLHALTSSCLPDPQTKVTGTESALQILQSAAARSFDFLTDRHIDLLVQIANLSTKRSFYPTHERVMQQVWWDTNLPALSQDPRFRTSVIELFDHAAQMQIFDPDRAVFDSLRDARKEILSDSALDRRNLSRTSLFYRIELGASQRLTFPQDEKYTPRDTQAPTGRSERATIAATLILRDKFALHESIPDLKDVLLRSHFSKKTIEGVNDSFVSSSLRYDSKWLGDFSTHLRKLWCSLHEGLIAPSGDVNVFDIMTWLSTMAYAESADMVIIQALAALYKDPVFAKIHVPSAPTFKLAAGNAWKLEEVQSIVKRNLLSFDNSAECGLPKLPTETEQQHIRRIEYLFKDHQTTAYQTFVLALQKQWPVRRPSKPKSTNIDNYIHAAAALEVITVKFEDWCDNREFLQYLDRVSRQCKSEELDPVDQPRYMLLRPIKKDTLSQQLRHPTPQEIFAAAPPCFFPESSKKTVQPQFEMPCEPTIAYAVQSLSSDGRNVRARLEQLCDSLQNYATSKTERAYVEHLRTSCAALDEQICGSPEALNVSVGFKAQLQKYLRDCTTFLDDFNHTLAGCAGNSSLFSDRIGQSTSHSVRLSPQFWLSQLHRDRFDSLSDVWKSIIVKYGLAITHLHRAIRLVAFSNKPIDLYEELRHVGHNNWDPLHFPETLLLEAESGIMVRKEQEIIASHMRLPKNGENAVLQLQMGGGKSSTIMPTLAAYFTDKKMLVRTIVAKPQSQQMLQMLVSKLGGLLNRRIYHLPFSRNVRLTFSDAENIRKLYEDCVQNRGVLLIQPEHILSFKLMAIESVLTDQPELARSMLATQAYFDQVTRDIIDEVDENLSVKFELIYTMGSQESIDYAPERWSIIQQVLGLLPRFAFEIQKRMPEAIDIQDVGDGRFPRVRLLRQDAAHQLLESLAQHIVEWGLSGLPTRSLSDEMQTGILRYITEPQLNTRDIDKVEKSKFWSTFAKLPLLLVRGLIAGGVLRFTLSTKRWRVNYGLDPNRTPNTSLAVPYRSKDSPSPRSEFSHSDVVLILTHLSQYYGGLSDEQLFDTLGHVLNSDQCDIHYQEFVHTASSSLPAAFRQLSGVSIRDRHQCITEVFPSLRYSKNTVDYYLTHLVFPKECKQFPQKLSASGWDLGASKTHPTTGFSGTNDTLHLLPLDVKHIDLASQKHTNAQVLAYLLEDETSVKLLPPCTNPATSDGEHLLTVIQGLESDARVVLDCGASILELNNREVAKAWLRMRGGDVEAVVYFEDEKLSVLDRTGRIEAFQTSPYAKQLDVCIVYLDESHTRGTDLKLPRDYRAVVTLGAQLTKDRLTQACMRLRKLGHGQSVTFIVPQEIATKIRELTAKTMDDPITVTNIICWSISETWQDLRRSMPPWAVQGRRFEKCKHIFDGVNTTKDQAKAFLEDEAHSLESRYKPTAGNDAESPRLAGWDLSNKNIALIVARCRDFEAMGFESAELSEEQERELTPEIEEERQIERPPKMEAEIHVLHPDLVQLAHDGHIPRHSTAFEPAFRALRSTSLRKLLDLEQLSAFPKDLLVTADFMRTVKIPSGSSRATFNPDAYQRPVQFVLTTPSIDRRETNQAIVISPFEANKLQSIIRVTQKLTLHLFAARSNGGFASLDQLMLYNVGRDFAHNSISRSLSTQLNLFAGSLYLRTLEEYHELCDFLGLLRASKVEPGQQVYADGFIEPPAGKWGLKQSPVPFLRGLLIGIRREGEGVEKTHLGKLLNGVRLEEADFRAYNL